MNLEKLLTALVSKLSRIFQGTADKIVDKLEQKEVGKIQRMRVLS